MRRCWLLLLLSLLAASQCGGGGGGGGDVRVRVRLETSDPHLPGVGSVDLDLRRDNVVVRDRLAAGVGNTLSFPVEGIFTVPIGPGRLQVEATARTADGAVLGGGDGEVTVASGRIEVVTIALYSHRSRPNRGRPVFPDGGEPTDAPPAPAPDAAAPGAGDAGNTGDTGQGGGDAGAGDGASADGAPPDAPAPGCVMKTHRVIAGAVVSVDQGPPPRDPSDTRVLVSSGVGHDHVHDFVGWMRFDLAVVPDRAALVSMRVTLELEQPPLAPPPLGILYSSDDGWNADTLGSETADRVRRTARVSGDLGVPHARRDSYAVDVPMYQRFWSGDLADDVLTLGMISTTALDAPETWATFYGLASPAVAPALDIVTCE
jgi:hypothetical protein